MGYALAVITSSVTTLCTIIICLCVALCVFWAWHGLMRKGHGGCVLNRAGRMLQVLRQDRAPLLYSLVFGEGVINDATAVALLRAVQVAELA